MPQFIVESSSGRILVSLKPDEIEVVPVDERGEAKREAFDTYDSTSDLATFISEVGEVPRAEAERIVAEVAVRSLIMRRSRWRPWLRRERRRARDLHQFTSAP